MDLHGNGILSSAMSAGKKLASSKLGKALAKQAVKAGSKYASNYIPPSVANAIAEEAVDRIEGQGLLSSAMKGAKAVAGSKLGKALAKQAVKAGSKYASNYIPSSVANAIAEETVDRIEGQGFLNNAIKGVVSAGKKVAKNKLVRAIADAGVKAGTEAVLESRRSLVPAVAKALSGSGVRRKKGKTTRGGALFPAGMGVDVYYD